MTSKMQEAARQLKLKLEAFKGDSIAEVKHPKLTEKAMRQGVDLALINADKTWKASGLKGFYVVHARLEGSELVAEFRPADGGPALTAKGNFGRSSSPIAPAIRKVGPCLVDAGHYSWGAVYVTIACWGYVYHIWLSPK